MTRWQTMARLAALLAVGMLGACSSGQSTPANSGQASPTATKSFVLPCPATTPLSTPRETSAQPDDLVVVNGVRYLGSGQGSLGTEEFLGELGPEVARVTCTVASMSTSVDVVGEWPDGTAGYLPVGSILKQASDIDPGCQLIADTPQGRLIYRAVLPGTLEYACPVA